MNASNEILFLHIDDLHPHPDNPRKELGDLTELAASIKARGVMQNLTVVPADDGYTIIIGHRRAAASKLAGLSRMPCIVADLTPREQMEVMLTENMQRADLTPIEQAQSMQQLVIDFGATPEDIAEKTGFSVRTVKHRLEIAKLDREKLKAAEDRQITIAALEDLEKIKDVGTREKLLDVYGTANFFGAREKAINEQIAAERLPEIIDRLERAQIRKVPKSLEGKMWGSHEYRGNLYVHEVTDEQLDSDIGNAKKRGAAGKQIYYELNENYCGGKTVRIWWEKPKKEKEIVKKTKKEKEREELIKDRIKALTELSETAYKKRYEHIRSMSLGTITRYQVEAMLNAFAALAIRSTVDYIGDPKLDTLMNIDGREPKTTANRREVRDEMLHQLENVNDGYAHRMELRALYACYNDSANLKYWHPGYGGEDHGFPVHDTNATLDMLYRFLELTGYELSDDEKALMNGTHELFKDPEHPKK